MLPRVNGVLTFQSLCQFVSDELKDCSHTGTNIKN